MVKDYLQCKYDICKQFKVRIQIPSPQKKTF